MTIDTNKVFDKGEKGTVVLKNGAQFSYRGPWIYLLDGKTTRLDRWHMGTFMAAEYTVVAEFSNIQKEIIKCIVVAGPDKVDLTVYGKADLGQNLIEISAVVNNSYVDINLTPISKSITGIDYSKTKAIFQATYFESINPIVA